MDEKREESGRSDAFARVFEWINEKLMGPIGPPPLGPYNESAERAQGLCPVCGHPMGEHFIDHSSSNAVLHCPAPPLAKPESAADLNEVGMPRSDGGR